MRYLSVSNIFRYGFDVPLRKADAYLSLRANEMSEAISVSEITTPAYSGLVMTE